VKKGWELVNIGAHCRFENGDRGKNYPGRKAFVSKGVPFVNAGHLGKGQLDLSEMNYIPREHFERLGSGKIQSRDLLFCLRGSLGKYAVVDNLEEGAIASSLVIVRPSEKLSPHYLSYYFGSSLCTEEISQYANGAAQPNLSAKSLAAFKIPLPPLDEQQQIVAILDEAFEGLDRAKANTEANLKSARELFESIKEDGLAYREPDREEVVLSDVANITSGLVDPREDAYADMLHLGAGNMITGKDELVDVRTAREEKLKSGKYLFDEKAVLYSKIRPYLRKAARPDFQGLCSADVYPLTPKPDRLDKDFLFHMLLGHDFTEYAISGSDRAGMPKVNRNHMFAYRFELPPVEAQKRIATVIDEANISCHALVELANKKLQSLTDLRQSLLHKAFAGELT
jgi:type I restriction enzyme S subunit